METEQRYVTRLRYLGPDAPIMLNVFEQAEQLLGVWDTVRKCFVNRGADGEWTPEITASDTPTPSQT